MKSTDGTIFSCEKSMIPSHLFKLDDSRTPEIDGLRDSGGPCMALCPCFFRRSIEQHSMQIQQNPGGHGQERRNRTVDIVAMALSILDESGVEEVESSAVNTNTSKNPNTDKQTSDGNSKTEKMEVQGKRKEDDDGTPKID